IGDREAEIFFSDPIHPFAFYHLSCPAMIRRYGDLPAVRRTCKVMTYVFKKLPVVIVPHRSVHDANLERKITHEFVHYLDLEHPGSIHPWFLPKPDDLIGVPSIVKSFELDKEKRTFTGQLLSRGDINVESTMKSQRTLLNYCSDIYERLGLFTEIWWML